MKLDIEKEEHLDSGKPRKAVGLFARDAFGSGSFELSAISTASGAVLSTNAAGGGGGTSTVFIANAVGNTTLNPSPNFIGIVTIANPAAVAGMVTLFPGPNHIGSVTIFGTVQSTPGMTTLFPGPNFIGLVTVGNNPTVTVSNLLSLASGTEVRSLATVLGGSVGISGLISLASGTEVRTRPVSNVTLNASAAYIGLASVNIGGTLPALAAGANYVGLVTTFPARSVTTNFAGILSASGYNTIFVPPNGQRFILHTAMINSKGVADGYIGSTSNPLIPFVGLATYGGFVHPNDILPATAVDQSLTIRQHSLVTIGYQVSVHFE